MTLLDCIQVLMRVRGNGGNLLLNTGPDGKGNMTPSHVQRYLDMGKWLTQYGEAFYETRGGPYRPGPWGCSTRSKDGKTVYLIGMTEANIIHVPQIGALESVEMMTGGRVSHSQEGQGWTFDMTKASEPVSIIKLQLKTPIQSHFSIQSTGEGIDVKSIHASSEHPNYGVKNLSQSSGGKFSEGIMVQKGWVPDAKDTDVSLEIELTKVEMVKQLEILYGSKLGAVVKTAPFSIESFHEGQWQTVYESETLSMHKGVVLEEPISCTKLRLKFKSKQGVKINAIRLYHPL
jgi:alpha-L-fucosidase